MTWRERIQAARERGTFTRADEIDIGQYETCMVGEASQPLTEQLGKPAWHVYPELRALGARTPVMAIYTNNFDVAEERLDAIEDAVLELKRHQGGLA